MMGAGRVSTVTSTVTPSSSLADRSGNLGSWHADTAAETIALPRGMTGIGMPMHPRSSPAGCVLIVTKAPASSEKRGSPGTAGVPRPAASASTADLASATASSPKGIVAPRSP